VVGIAVHHQLPEPLVGQAQERFEPALQRRHRRRTSAGAKARLYHEVPVCVRGPLHEIVHNERPDAVLELIVMASLEEFLREDAAAACECLVSPDCERTLRVTIEKNHAVNELML